MGLNLKQLKVLIQEPPEKAHNEVTFGNHEPDPEPPATVDINKEYFPFADLKELKDTAAEMNDYFKTATFKPSKVDYKKMVDGSLQNIRAFWHDKKYVISRVIDLKTIKEKYTR